MKMVVHNTLACLLFGSIAAAGHAQVSAPPPPASATDPATTGLDQRIDAISAALAATQQQLDESQRQMRQMQQELLQLRQQIASGAASAQPSGVPSNAAVAAASSSSQSSAAPQAGPAPDQTTATIEERQQAVEAAVKVHDQSKVESASKYPVRVTGLILFNSFLNKGLPDSIDVPSVALHQTSTSGNGSLGATLRQTILGIEGVGPRIGGAHTSANVNIDFFSGLAYTSYGTSAGSVRMRTASVDFDWAKDSVELGLVGPLISPLSPTSYATVAEPSLAGAGNLWNWAAQLRYAHQIPLSDDHHVKFEFGLWDSPSAGYNGNQQLVRVASPAELAQQPGYETRVSYGSAGDRGLQLGAGGYYSRQAYPGYQGYPGTENLDSWAGTADWRLPFAHHFEISGEAYRGRSIGGLGGGDYKDVIAGNDPVSGAAVLHGLNAVGGWTQLKMRFSQSLETNFSFGLDDGFARDFHAVVLPSTATATQLRARNEMAIANLIFRPKTYIILSPEYRRIWTFPINSTMNSMNIFTLSAGYQF
jgi:uncharacterized coiled-coil protein SlyX